MDGTGRGGRPPPPAGGGHLRAAGGPRRRQPPAPRELPRDRRPVSPGRLAAGRIYKGRGSAGGCEGGRTHGLAGPLELTSGVRAGWRERAAALFPGGVNSPVRAYRAVGGEAPVLVRGEG